MTLEKSSEIQAVKDAVDLALDHIESAGLNLADITRPGRDSLTERLSRILEDLEQWKADVWEEVLDR